MPLNKLDRDRAKNARKSKAFNYVEWKLNQEKNHQSFQTKILHRLSKIPKKKLTSWEKEFVLSLERQVKIKGDLSSKQLLFLNKIELKNGC